MLAAMYNCAADFLAISDPLPQSDLAIGERPAFCYQQVVNPRKSVT